MPASPPTCNRVAWLQVGQPVSGRRLPPASLKVGRSGGSGGRQGPCLWRRFSGLWKLGVSPAGTDSKVVHKDSTTLQLKPKLALQMKRRKAAAISAVPVACGLAQAGGRTSTRMRNQGGAARRHSYCQACASGVCLMHHPPHGARGLQAARSKTPSISARTITEVQPPTAKQHSPTTHTWYACSKAMA